MSYRLTVLVTMASLLVAGCSDPLGDDPLPNETEPGEPATVAGVTPGDVDAAGSTIHGNLGGLGGFAAIWVAFDRGYAVDQILATPNLLDGTGVLAGIEPTGPVLGLYGASDAQALGAEVLTGAGGATVHAASAVLAESDEEELTYEEKLRLLPPDQQYVEFVARTMLEIYLTSATAVLGPGAPAAPADLTESQQRTVVVATLSLAARGFSAEQIIEALVLGDAERIAIGPGVDCWVIQGAVPDGADRMAADCGDLTDADGDEPVVADEGTSPDGGEASADGEEAWVGTLPRSPLGAFQAGTVATNEIVVEIADVEEVADQVAQATIVYEVQGVPVFTEAGQVLCSADLLFVFEFAPLPVPDPRAFELIGRMEFFEANRRGSDCSRASPTEPIDQPATALFTTDVIDPALSTLELLVAGERVYDQPIQLTFG